MGMAPDGKIKKPKESVEEHLQNFLAIADAMAENKNWGYLAQYSILKEMLADLHTIADDTAGFIIEAFVQQETNIVIPQAIASSPASLPPWTSSSPELEQRRRLLKASQLATKASRLTPRPPLLL